MQKEIATDNALVRIDRAAVERAPAPKDGVAWRDPRLGPGAIVLFFTIPSGGIGQRRAAE
jgi:hypothetical protein